MASDYFAVLTGIWARLDGQLAVDVYSHVPQDAAFPYVAISSGTVAAADDKVGDRQELTFMVHSWNKNVSSFETVMDIMKDVRAALHKQEANITVAGFKVVLARIEFEEILQEGASGVGGDHYYHGVSRLRIIVEDI